MKFGRLPHRHDPRTIQLMDYVKPGAPPIPPATKYWEDRLGYWGMLANDRVGDCTVAAAGHQVMLWTTYSGFEFIPSDGQILADYAAITGYDPVSGMNDNGAVCIDVLNFWRKQGMLGRRIDGYAQIDVGDIQEVKQAIYLFGSVYVGFDVPQSAMDQLDVGQPWDIVNTDGGIVGGHAVAAFGYDNDYIYVCTWGKIQKMKWNFWKWYVTEAYAISSPYWFNKKGVTPAGFGIAELRRDLCLMGQRS